MKKDLIRKFNQSTSLLVISGYPKKKETYSQNVCAVSSFSKNVLLGLQKENPLRKIVVLAPIITKPETYEENGLLIVRCFKRNAPLSYSNLLKTIYNFGKVKDILLEFEFASFGDTFMTGLLAPIAWTLSLARKNLTIVVHQVVSEMENLSGHIGVNKQSLRMKLLDLSLEAFYALLTLPAKKVIVLEEEFKKKLSKFTNKNKIVVIPHGIDTNIKKVSQISARKKLGIDKNEFVVLYFGYLTWYKGVDFIINALKDVKNIKGKKLRLLIAGGPSFTQEKKQHYQLFLKKIDKLVGGAGNVSLTGFVPEENIAAVFAASNLSVLPYRTFMSASGPLSLAISYEKPFIISENLEDIAKSSDIKKALDIAGINKKQISFKLTKQSLLKTIKMTIDPAFNQKLLNLSRILKEERSFANIAVKYNQVLSQESKAQTINAKNGKLAFINRPL